MAYGRYDNRSEWREPRQRSDERFEDRSYSRAYRGDYDRGFGRDDERGFLDRAGDEIASWFGDDDAERRRRMDARQGSDDDGFIRSRTSGLMSERDYDRYSREPRFRDEGYRRPYTGRTGGRGFQERWDRGVTQGGASGMAAGLHDPHYDALRRRQMDELDRDYDEYRRENQSRFESDFSNWREQRMTKRQMLGQVREAMEVTGSDGEHVGTIDCVKGDRIILAKSDSPDGHHHSLSCTSLDRVEENRVMLNCTAAEAKAQWRDDHRDRALFEREDQGEAGPGILERSFSGTY